MSNSSSASRRGQRAGSTAAPVTRPKRVFKMAAQKNARREPFSQYYDRLVQGGTRPALAQVSLARKIAAITLTLWQREEDFDAARIAATA